MKLDFKTLLVLLETQNFGRVSWKIPRGSMQVEARFLYVYVFAWPKCSSRVACGPEYRRERNSRNAFAGAHWKNSLVLHGGPATA